MYGMHLVFLVAVSLKQELAPRGTSLDNRGGWVRLGRRPEESVIQSPGVPGWHPENLGENLTVCHLPASFLNELKLQPWLVWLSGLNTGL